MDFETWRQNAEQLLYQRCAINFEDAGFAEVFLHDAWKAGDAPAGFVEHVALKLDLLPRDENWARTP